MGVADKGTNSYVNSTLVVNQYGIGVGGNTQASSTYALNVAGSAACSTLSITSTSGVAHLAFGRGGYNYITTPTSGTINIVTGGRSLSSANSTAVFTDTDIRPGANSTYSLGYIDPSSATNNRL